MDLWHFSIHHYQDPAVQADCLALQDQASHDVLAVLYGLWRGFSGQAVPPDEWRAILSWLAPWRDAMVSPLRGLRRDLKVSFEDWPSATRTRVRDAILAAELSAERAALDRMGAGRLAAIYDPAFITIARNNLEVYAQTAGLASCALYDGLLNRIAQRIKTERK